MEEKESTFSGSLGNSDTDSPPPNSFNHTLDVSSQVVNTAVNVSSETTLLGPPPPPPPPPPPAPAPAPAPTVTTVTTAQELVAPNTGVVGVQGNVEKKKRGRPRKYDADGNLRPGQTHNSAHVTRVPPSAPPGFYLSPGSPNPTEFSIKNGRGRPAGSGNWQVLASLETAGGDFTPHVVTVGTGEDVAGRILSFSEKGPRGICILSANGAVSNVTIRQPGSTGGILTYEGRFELLSLSGSFTVMEIGGVRSRTGGLSVSLAGPDGRVIGGSIAGMLTAASPIQIVVGSFMPNGGKPQKRHYRENAVASPISSAPDTVAAATPISQAQPEIETRFTPVVPLPAQSHGEADKGIIQNQNFNYIPNSAAILMPTNAGWNGMELKSEHRPSPDINLSVQGN
ncbi:AT-hook motif nuclear-localized protein 1-like [Argentina anserina]|uniref:AT-hook motif nuclear-localized protein 1-like n=1 Tax=Argentina anserina TaxID=57926 RepID=UPI00217630E3|nr:AT-hook motif nuclear-localized protein 1-like [Potentilla anserina]